MNPLELIAQFPEIMEMVPEIERALGVIEAYKNDGRSQKALITLQRILNDPDVKTSIAFLQTAVKDPNITALIETARKLTAIVDRKRS